MLARVTTFTGSPAEVESGIDSFRANVVPFAREQSAGVILLIDRVSGDGMAITLWADEEALNASEERANALRADAVERIGAAAEPTIGRYEVAVFEI